MRWVHLLLGGALFIPYVLLAWVVAELFAPGAALLTKPGWLLSLSALALPLVAGTGLLPFVRPLEAVTVQSLGCLPKDAVLATDPARSWSDRKRTAAWFTMHVGAGAVVSGATLATAPMAVILISLPFSQPLRDGEEWNLPWTQVAGRMPWAAPLAGLAALLALVALTYGGGALLARCAPALLGPSRADRLAAAERRAAELTARNQLARELHDSVGHALSAVTLQASAARRVLESDPDFAREALRAIEETTRGAVGELDTVLGVLRGRGGADDPAARPTLAAALDGLVARTRATGAELTVVITGSVDGADTDTAALEELPAEVSRAAYRMVQEGIGNALRHAEGAAIALRLTLSPRALVLAVENPLTGGASSQMAPRVGGGSGLSGIAERAEQLGGSASAGPEGRLWRLTARLPLAG